MSALVKRSSGVIPRPSHQVKTYKVCSLEDALTGQAGTLILDFQLPELLENKFLLFKPPTYGILSWQPYRRQQKWFMQLRALKLLYHWLLPLASSPIRQAEFPIPL